MFFDALGRFALGQASVASSAIILPATAGAVAITGVAAAFADSFSAGAGAYSVSGVTVGFKDTIAAAAGSYSTVGKAAVLAGSLLAVSGSYTVSGVAASFPEAEVAQGGAFALSVQAPRPLVVGLTPAVGVYGVVGTIEAFVQTPAGLDALGRLALGQMSNAAPIIGVSVAIKMPSAGSASVIASGNNTLVRTGADFDLVYGGIGHYLEEIERIKSLAKITRKTPAPIVQQSGPLPAMPSAPVAPTAPAIDLQALAARRLAQQQAQAEQAGILKRRRQEIEILLLAS
jgi:hypothetical protein